MGWSIYRISSAGGCSAMRFVETALSGAYLLEPEPVDDARGFFARTFCQKEFAERDLVTEYVQCNISFNHKAGTVRGMHYQADPHPETKLVRCTQGAIFDVIVDLRPHSATYLEWVGSELNAGNRKMFYIPAGFAHGFQTLQENSEVFYQMSAFYQADCARGVRWDDKAIDVTWPLPITIISEKDQSFADIVTESSCKLCSA